MKEITSQFGNKALNLIKLNEISKNSKNIIVPKFLIIPSDFAKKHYERCEILEIKNPEKIHNKILQSSIEDQKLIDTILEFTKKNNISKLIFRSSFCYEDTPTKSYAGIFESEVIYKINKRNIESAIKKVWASIFSKKALNYSELDIKKISEYGISIIVQQFISPQFSGVLLGFPNDYYCEMAFSSYNKITSGKNADISFWFHKFNRDLFDPVVYFKTQKKLHEFEALLREYPLRMNNIFKEIDKNFKNKSGYDIEFIISDNLIYIVQVRDLTSNISTILENIHIKAMQPKIELETNLPIWKTPHISWNNFIDTTNNILNRLNLNFNYGVDKNGISISLKDYIKLLDRISRDHKRFVTNMIKIFIDFVKDYSNLQEFEQEIQRLKSKNLKKLYIKMWSFFCAYEFIHALYRENISEKFQKFHVTDKITLLLRIKDYYTGKISVENLFNNLVHQYLVLKKMKFKENEDLFFRIKNLLDIFGKVYLGKISCIVEGSTHKTNDKSNNKIDNVKEANQKILNKRTIVFKNLIPIVNKTFYGRVLKVLNPHLKALQKKVLNRILVAKETNIDYLPLMIKSKAIVTQEGNYTCHAAIVSRELNKPCVVGVQEILSYCHDNDYIEYNNNLCHLKLTHK